MLGRYLPQFWLLNLRQAKIWQNKSQMIDEKHKDLKQPPQKGDLSHLSSGIYFILDFTTNAVHVILLFRSKSLFIKSIKLVSTQIKSWYTKKQPVFSRKGWVLYLYTTFVHFPSEYNQDGLTSATLMMSMICFLTELTLSAIAFGSTRASNRRTCNNQTFKQLL